MLPKKTIVQVNNPCLINIKDMPVAKGGNFCTVCNKVVVDFTNMTNEEMVTYLHNTSKNICGTFNAEQLNTPIVYKTNYKNNIFYFLASIISFVIPSKIFSQIKSIHSTNKQRSTFKPSQIIKGKVTNTKNKAIQAATVIAINNKVAVVTDKNGNFKLPLNASAKSTTIKIKSIGYKTYTYKLHKKSLSQFQYIKLTQQIDSLNEVEVRSPYGTLKKTIMGSSTTIQVKEKCKENTEHYE